MSIKVLFLSWLWWVLYLKADLFWWDGIYGSDYWVQQEQAHVLDNLMLQCPLLSKVLNLNVFVWLGMLPHKTKRGQAALERLKVFDGIPPPYDKVMKDSLFGL